MNRVHTDYSDEKIQETFDMVNGHLEEHFETLSKLMDIKVSKKLNKTIESIILKTIQKSNLNYEMNYRTLEEGFKGLSFKTKCSVYFGTTIKRLKQLIGMGNEKNR